MMIHVVYIYCKVLLRRNIRAQIAILSDLTLIKEDAIIKNLHVISSVLLRFDLRIPAPFHHHHGLKDPHLLLSVVLIVHAFALMIELLIHLVVVAATYHALIV